MDTENKPKGPQYNESERMLLRQARAFQDMVQTAGWKYLEAIMNQHLADRERVLNTPFSALPDKFRELDAMSKMVEIECIKGAIIGIRLIRDIPRVTIEHASELVKSRNPGSTSSDEGEE